MFNTVMNWLLNNILFTLVSNRNYVSIFENICSRLLIGIILSIIITFLIVLIYDKIKHTRLSKETTLKIYPSVFFLIVFYVENLIILTPVGVYIIYMYTLNILSKCELQKYLILYLYLNIIYAVVVLIKFVFYFLYYYHYY
ncbi:hypothetical protein CFT12S05168_02355 [Campylobacter fetus subsp. testudinum]|nr:hypothetical protein CFT12S05168_02355 [Campylobacter fetus subsp. testudinum]